MTPVPEKGDRQMKSTGEGRRSRRIVRGLAAAACCITLPVTLLASPASAARTISATPTSGSVSAALVGGQYDTFSDMGTLWVTMIAGRSTKAASTRQYVSLDADIYRWDRFLSGSQVIYRW